MTIAANKNIKDSTDFRLLTKPPDMNQQGEVELGLGSNVELPWEAQSGLVAVASSLYATRGKAPGC